MFGSVYIPDAFFSRRIRQLREPERKADSDVRTVANGQPAPIVAGGHQTYGIVIEPAFWGASGLAYMGNGGYHDTLIATAEGWRFKARNYRWDMAFPGARVDRVQQVAPQ